MNRLKLLLDEHGMRIEFPCLCFCGEDAKHENIFGVFCEKHFDELYRERKDIMSWELADGR